MEDDNNIRAIRYQRFKDYIMELCARTELPTPPIILFLQKNSLQSFLLILRRKKDTILQHADIPVDGDLTFIKSELMAMTKLPIDYVETLLKKMELDEIDKLRRYVLYFANMC